MPRPIEAVIHTAALAHNLARARQSAPHARVWAVVKVDPAVLDDTLERVNISLPRRVLHRLDALARATGETRSGFIARMALEGHQATT